MQKNVVSDQELVSAYLNGDESSFEVLLKRHQERIFIQIRSLIRDSEIANDIFQETFVKAIRTLKMGKYNEEGKFLPWILRIAHNLSIDHYRKAKKMPKSRSSETFDIFSVIPRDENNVEESMILDGIHDDVRKLIEHLPPDQREVVILRHFGGLSYKEIAEQCDVSINTSLGRMRYALINMRKLISEHNIVLTR